MITFSSDCRIYISLEAIDFRCGLNKLVPLAQSRFALDPRDHAVFVFRNRRRTDIKMIFFDRNGFFMGHKRLSRGKLEWWPRTKDECLGLNSEELFRLLLGVDPRGNFHPSWARRDGAFREDFADQRRGRLEGAPFPQQSRS